jgi:hypothetical protein
VALFTPPTDDIVPPIYMPEEDPWYPCDPLMNRLMRHYRNQTRGRNIFLMSDGTVRDSQIQGTPPNMIQPPTDPYARSIYESGGALIEQDFFQIPYVTRTLYGGSDNVINTAEAATLTAAGYGAYIH